jgi:TetR/AcrR family transcriptional regulator, regulator of biofilm formation and stress response
MEALAGSDTRERIMRTTLDLIGQEGLAAVTNRRVATSAGTSLGTLTYHFASQHDLLRESLLLFVDEEVSRLEAIAAGLREFDPEVEQVAIEVERTVREAGSRMQGLVEVELHIHAARDPALRDASRRCFEAYEDLATASLEALGVADPEIHARSVVALLYGLALRRIGTGDDDASGTAEALLSLARGTQPSDRARLA